MKLSCMKQTYFFKYSAIKKKKKKKKKKSTFFFFFLPKLEKTIVKSESKLPYLPKIHFLLSKKKKKKKKKT